MHRFLVPLESAAGELIQLPEAEAHHATRVLRLQPGDVVVLLDGAGGELTGSVETLTRQDVTVRITARRQHPPRPFAVTLVQAIAKGPAMEGLLHRAVELGCARVVPLVAERSVSRPDDTRAKQAKWQAIAGEAAKQSGNPWRMEVDPALTPAAWLARSEAFDLRLIASLVDAPQHPRLHLGRFRDAHGRAPRSIAVIIGPEGDFSPTEYGAFHAAGALPITLGPHVLRVETAATYALAVLNYELTSG